VYTSAAVTAPAVAAGMTLGVPVRAVTMPVGIPIPVPTVKALASRVSLPNARASATAWVALGASSNSSIKIGTKPWAL